MQSWGFHSSLRRTKLAFCRGFPSLLYINYYDIYIYIYLLVFAKVVANVLIHSFVHWLDEQMRVGNLSERDWNRRQGFMQITINTILYKYKKNWGGGCYWSEAGKSHWSLATIKIFLVDERLRSKENSYSIRKLHKCNYCQFHLIKFMFEKI